LRKAFAWMLLGLGVSVAACSAQSPAAPGGITLDAAMVKGPPTAPVTIVEFSDYQ
jgi:protein-disulfide isomerase